MVTGARGLLGKALVAQFGNDCEVRAFDHSALDIADREAVSEQVASFSPELIVNCAAAARVDACEDARAQAWATNAVGPGFLASAAREIGAQIVHLSTDYLFDGEKRTPYTIEDEPRPISFYGESKLAGERAVIAATDNYYIVRVARLFGPGGTNFGSRVFRYLQNAYESSSKVKVFGYPTSQATYLPDLVARLREIAVSGAYGIYHV